MPLTDLSGPRSKSRAGKLFAAAACPCENKAPRTRPFSIRLTDGEREALKAAAGAKPIGVFARERLLEKVAERRPARRSGLDRAMLARVLATLGKSGLATNLADLRTAAELGKIELTPEVQATLRAACADIQDVKRLLLRSLGLTEERGR